MLLAIDIGTSTFKAGILGYNGERLQSLAFPMTFDSREGSYHTADPAQWLQAFCHAASQLANLDKVEGIIISGNGPTVVPVTGEVSFKNGAFMVPADSARLWLDRRAQEESNAISAIVGGYVDPSFVLPKVLYIKNREEALYEKTNHIFSSSEFLAYALTGEARTVFPSEGFDRWYWNNETLEAAGLDAEKFPPFIEPGGFIGTVLPEVAQHFGFSRTLPVLAGGPDFFVAILGTGTVDPGQTCDRSGTSEGINACTVERIVDPRLMSYGHPVKPYWNCSGIIATTGKALSWGRDLLGMKDLPYQEYYAFAATAKPGAGGVVFLPYLAGERAPIWDPHARGVFLGLHLGTGPAELARAVAEGVCFAIQDVITVINDLGGDVSELRVTGGPGESTFLNQLKADISGCPVLRPTNLNAELLGLGVIGAAALGRFASFKEAADNMVTIEETYFPQEAHRNMYADLFSLYRESYRALKIPFQQLDAAITGAV